MKRMINANNKICLVISLIIFSLLLQSQISHAANIEVVKNSTKDIQFGDILEVSVKINNLENSDIQVNVKEHIANADPIQPGSFSTEKCPYKICIEWPYYEWNITLPSLSAYTITYKIKPKTIGIFSIGPTEVQTSSGQVFESDTLVVNVHCISNGICEQDKGENYFTCPEDCPSGSRDGVCDLIKDGRCDSDCAPGADADCLGSTTTSVSTTTTTTVILPKPSTPIYIYIIIAVIVIAVIIFLLSKIKVVR